MNTNNHECFGTDPLTALGLASNIVQFVDFTSKIISAAHSLYESASGAKTEHLELETLAKSLRSLADRATPPLIQKTKTLPAEDLALIELGELCRGVSDDLLSVLESLKVKGSNKGWKSFYQALRSEWKQSEIAALQVRINRIGSILNAQIMFKLWLKVSQTLENLEVQNYRVEAARSDDLRVLVKNIKEHFGDIEKVIKEMHHGGIPTKSLKELSLSAEHGIRYSAEQGILELLRFDDMEGRHANIRPPHDKTFPWIFQNSALLGGNRSASKFVEWMVSEDSLYWISGKPGSGKSTLMKYVSNHDLTRINLRKWSEGSRLIIAKFFFWAASREDLPKSQEGLLRSIIYQMLGQCPDLIPRAFPSQWNAYTSPVLDHHQSGNDKLKLPELLAALASIVSQLVANKIKFCFFIDGLDEYKGKPNDIIPLIETFISSPNIKTCVSSRPWNEFEKVYGQTISRKLYIEEFNRPDIERYVRDTLESDVTYQELQETDDSTPDLVKDVVNAASGVFLWVYLVVQSLIDGLTNGDRILDLQRRLRVLPKTLKEFFKSIFNNIDEFYMEQTAHMFLVTLVARNTLPLLAYWFIEQDDPNFAMKLEVQPLSMQKTNLRLKLMRKRLNACCKGLLEV
jgi:hypothetical protein